MIVATLAILHAGPKFPLTIESIMRGPALVGHAPRGLRWSPDGKTLAFSWAKADGSADPSYASYLVDRDGQNLRKGTLPEPPDDDTPIGSRFGDKVAHTRSGNLFLWDAGSRKSTPVLESSDAKDDPILVARGTAVVYQQDGDLYRIELGSKRPVRLTRFGDAKEGSLVAIPAGWRKGSWSVSASGRYASLGLNQSAAGGGRRASVPNYVTSSGYVEMLSTYEKVGAPQSHAMTLVVDLANGATTRIETPRPGRVGALRWSKDGSHAIAYGSTDDHKDGYIFGFDVATGKSSVLWNEHDDAWIGGPGRGLLAWFPDGSRFYFESEKTGFANLWTMAADGTDARNLTDGPFEASSVRIDEPRGRFVFVSSEGSPFRRHIDAVPMTGGPRVKLADYSADEDATFAMSPDGSEFAVVRSASNRPSELFLSGRQVTTTPTDEFLAGPWIDPPIVMVPARDGAKIPSRLYRPKNWRRGGPAVVFAHGAGYLQNVYDGWSHYFREYMFHHVLMDHGYAVLDMDFRASAGYGKAWRTAIYRHMGGVDLNDNVDGAAYLVKELGVAKDRIGIYGGSYGGFLTLMAMFTAPDVFAAGAALRPVGDWTNYNHGYTSEILNVPKDDPEAYRLSSPINYVSGLKGSLLICHGMVDVNVQFQDSVRIVQKLIELGKPDWEVAPYPVEDHAFTRASSWTDEYRRIFALFERTIGSKRGKR